MPRIITLSDVQMPQRPSPPPDSLPRGWTHLHDAGSFVSGRILCCFRVKTADSYMIAVFPEGSLLDLNSAAFIITPDALLYSARRNIAAANRCLPSKPNHPWDR